MKPIPEFVKMIGPYIYLHENEGITAITIFKYDKEKAGDSADAIANGFITFNGIPGYRYSIRLALGVSATMKMRGLNSFIN